MKISVAICTWNRAKLLDQTLEKMQALKIPDGVDWEVLVVNNNCTDDTSSVVQRHQGRLPIRGLHEPKQGHSHSRNCAVAAASGDLLLWTDDDVLVDDDWLTCYAVAARENPGDAFFGGPVEPWFERQPPSWFQSIWPRVQDAYAIRNLGDQPIAFTEEKIPFGANFAVRMDVQRQNLFDPQTGRKGSGMVGGDETTVLVSLLRAGLSGRWIPQARVLHFIPSERMTLSYLRRYFYGQGQTAALFADHSNAATLFGGPRWLLRKALLAEFNYRRRRYVAKPLRWIEPMIEASLAWGQYHGSKNESS
ncbi:hypothetical protein CKO51_25835 [Rhodopirellula sp. SM50]|nr:glycosyltransferase [Rhodopirellula sp. SM50]PAY16600.1 hypothetical protein CKO51_25835 [Rhodopirellula sp. SM50]